MSVNFLTLLRGRSPQVSPARRERHGFLVVDSLADASVAIDESLLIEVNHRKFISLTQLWLRPS